MLYDDQVKSIKRNLKRMQVVRRTTYVCGINMSEPTRWKKLVIIHAFIILIMASYSVYGHICFITYHRSSVSKITESLCTCLSTAISILKLTAWVCAHQRFYKLVKTIVESELFNEVKILDRSIDKTKKLRVKVIEIVDQCWNKTQNQLRFYISSCIIICLFYTMNAVLTNIHNQIKGHHDAPKLFVFSTRYPGLEEAKQHLPFFAVIMIVDEYASFTSGIVAAVYDGYFAYFTLHAVALFKSLKEMITYTASKKIPKEEKLFYLQECARHYIRSVKFCDEINALYSTSNLFQLLFSLLVLSVISFKAMQGLETSSKVFINMVFYISAAICQLVIYCFNGQSVTTETENIAEAWYSCNWYDESRKFKTVIYMMILRSSRTYYISAAGFTTISRATFLAVLRNSLSYYMLLRNISSI